MPRIQTEKNHPFIERKMLIQQLDNDLGLLEEQRIYVVCGPRGCGKSTAIATHFKERESVIQVQLDQSGINVFFREVVRRGNTCISGGVNLKDLIVTLFKTLKEEGKVAPILVNERCRPDDLETLIVCLKTW